MKYRKEKIGMNSNDKYFITPDRKCEQFLYRNGINFLETRKDETGWTYWVYERTEEVNNYIQLYIEHVLKRRIRLAEKRSKNKLEKGEVV